MLGLSGWEFQTWVTNTTPLGLRGSARNDSNVHIHRYRFIPDGSLLGMSPGGPALWALPAWPGSHQQHLRFTGTGQSTLHIQLLGPILRILPMC
jgi:hypothetical protein